MIVQYAKANRNQQVAVFLCKNVCALPVVNQVNRTAEFSTKMTPSVNWYSVCIKGKQIS